MPFDPVLSPAQRAFLVSARRAVLATIAPDGRPRLVPICFSLSEAEPVLYTPIDEKPKRGGDPLSLARVRDIRADPRVAVLVDRWDEDWSRLAWLRAEGTADILVATVGPREHAVAVRGLRARYAQYASQALEDRPVIRISLARVSDWGPLGEV